MPRKRATGIRRLGPHHYEIRIKRVDQRTGKEKEVRRRVKGSWDEAVAAKVDVVAELARGVGPSERQRLKDYANSWLRSRVHSLKPSTARKYADVLELHVLPALGDYYLDMLRPPDVADFVATQSARLAGWTVINQLRVLRTLAKDALAAGLCHMDFCARVKLPEAREFDEDDPNSLTAEQLGQLLKAIPQRWRAATLLMVSTGLRWGELSGLRWDDIDEVAGCVRVRRTNWKGMAVAPKTKKSKRTVPLELEVAEELRAHRARLLREQSPGLAAGWVFPTQEGGLHKGCPLLKVLHRALAAAGLGDLEVNVHGLRRTFNNLARPLVSREVLKSITGHTTDRMVEHYSVVSLEEKRAAAAGVLAAARGPEVDNKVDNSTDSGS